jgi:hypothetical protein
MEIIKNNIKLVIIVLLLGVIFVQRSCYNNSKQKVQSTSLPIIKGKFDKVKPIPNVIDTVYLDSIVYKDKIVKVDRPVDKKLVEDYLKANDSITKLSLYVNSVQTNTYTKTFSDEKIDITVNAETTGTLNLLDLTYKSKDIKVDLPVIIKRTTFAAYAGGGLNVNLIDIKPEYFVNAGIQNKRGDIILGGFGSNKTIQATYVFRILNITK